MKELAEPAIKVVKEDIVIKNIQNCLDPYHIEIDADEN